MLSNPQRQRLLTLAGESIQRGLGEGRQPPWSAAATDPDLDVQRASFVTLKINDMLRGCCGTLLATRALAADVWCNAWTSAFADPRFAPLTPDEYPQLDVQISVLSPVEP